jgi:hypothetical protein
MIRMMKSRKMRWVGHVAQMGEKRNAQDIGGKARRRETIGKSSKNQNLSLEKS